MTTEPCECCSPDEESSEASRPAGAADRRRVDADGQWQPADADDRWLGDADPMAAPLPADVRAGMERLLGAESVTTLAAWVDAIRRLTGGGAVDRAALCHADGETPHRGTLADETHHFRCFYDAVVLAELADAPVDVVTESPGGAVVEARATGAGDLAPSPERAVVSFGVVDGAGAPGDGEPTLRDAYAAVCPAVKAFPDRAAYERWAADAPAATVALPLADGLTVARGLAE